MSYFQSYTILQQNFIVDWMEVKRTPLLFINITSQDSETFNP